MNLVSIIIPVYRVEKYLDSCINSILSQSYTDLEIILVDDGSPDNCPQICDSYASQDKRIVVIHQANQGLSAARNSGLEKAKGNYIAFVDSDDYISSDYIQVAMDMFNSNNKLDLVEMPMVARFNTPHPVYRNHAKTETIEGNQNIIASWFRHQGFLYAYSQLKIYRRSLFNNVKFPVGKTFEDLHIIPAILSQCQCMSYVRHSSAAYFYRYRNDSITVQAKYEDFNSQVEALTRISRLSKQNNRIAQSDIHLFAIQTNNIVTDAIKAAKRQNIEIPIDAYTEIQEFMRSNWPNVSEAVKLPIPLSGKIKTILITMFPHLMRNLLGI